MQKFITLVQDQTGRTERHLPWCNRYVGPYGLVELEGIWPDVLKDDHKHQLMTNEMNGGAVSVAYFSDGAVQPVCNLEAYKNMLKERHKTSVVPVLEQAKPVVLDFPMQLEKPTMTPNAPQSFLTPAEQVNRKSDGSLIPRADKQHNELMFQAQSAQPIDIMTNSALTAMHPDMLPRPAAPELVITQLPGYDPVSGMKNAVISQGALVCPDPSVRTPAGALDNIPAPVAAAPVAEVAAEGKGRGRGRGKASK